jgi:hypothetical protein
MASSPVKLLDRSTPSQPRATSSHSGSSSSSSGRRVQPPRDTRQ